MKINSALAVLTPNRTVWCSDSAHWEKKNVFIPADLEDAGFFLFNIWRFYFSVHTPFAKHLSTSWGSSALIPLLIVIPCSHLTPFEDTLLGFPLRSQFWLCHKQSASSKPSLFPVPCSSISIAVLALLAVLTPKPFPLHTWGHMQTFLPCLHLHEL